jgi:hypothetical protein
MQEYPLIVVPEWEYLDAPFKAELTKYVKDGGNLLLIGPKSARLFETELGITFDGEPQAEPRRLLHDGKTVATSGLIQRVRPGESQIFGNLLFTNIVSSQSHPAATITTVGKGKIAATYFNIGQGYLANRSETTRSFLNDLAGQLFPNPLVTVTGSKDVDVAVARNDGKLLINLVNTSGPHVTAPIVDAIAPVGPLEISIRLATKPARITLAPEGKNLPFGFENGIAKLSVPQVNIHEIVVVE